MRISMAISLLSLTIVSAAHAIDIDKDQSTSPNPSRPSASTLDFGFTESQLKIIQVMFDDMAELLRGQQTHQGYLKDSGDFLPDASIRLCTAPGEAFHELDLSQGGLRDLKWTYESEDPAFIDEVRTSCSEAKKLAFENSPNVVLNQFTSPLWKNLNCAKIKRAIKFHTNNEMRDRKGTSTLLDSGTDISYLEEVSFESPGGHPLTYHFIWASTRFCTPKTHFPY